MSNPQSITKAIDRNSLDLVDSIFRLSWLLPRALYKNKLTILMYHGVLRQALSVPDYCFITESDFREQMEYLAKNCRVVALPEALHELKSGTIDYPTVSITFDDGYQNVFDVAFPVLREFHFPATVFVNTSFVGTPNTIWFCRLIQAISNTLRPTLEWRDFKFDLSTAYAKAVTSKRLQSHLKKLEHCDLLDQLEAIINQLNVDNGFLDSSMDFRILDQEAITAMINSGLIQFGAHTASHSILTRIPLEAARDEIEKSVQSISDLTGQPCRLFAYPNGGPTDYDYKILTILKDFGIVAAVTTIQGPNTAHTPMLELRRYGVHPRLTKTAFRCKVHHLLSSSNA
ncbi:polysaccharide deacetylase family protein [Methylocaldum sp.]|uniref:polysaccharide deacetylase family protein n=1 Tax=Methylocaldum sp. TaxID=1969727 RepID=UPI002D3C75F4|nr:polysaccharide deacetylase family protein [Methylocaldum sp.]HYE34627.1 polysaccharide deacetylase family protein [Methylocaldum sp.]